MRVLIVNDSIGTGSVGKIVLSLYNEMIKNNCECKIAYGRKNISSISENDLIKIGTKFDLYSHLVLSRVFGRVGTYSRFATKRALKRIKLFKPDVINIHSFYGYYVNMRIIMDYASENKIPVVFTLHSCWDFTGHCCYFTMNNCNGWRTGCKACPHKNEYPKTLLFESSGRNYELKRFLVSKNNTYVISPSKWIEGLAKNSLIYSSSTFLTIHNGIDLNTFKRIPSKKPDKPIVLCVASNWDKRKGLYDVVDLANYLGDSALIKVVGLNKKQIACLPKSILGIERTESLEELVKLYSSSTILFNPTYEDNYPTVNLEANACGLPVVSYDTGGSSETIKEYGGIIVKFKDFKTIKDYLFRCHRENIIVNPNEYHLSEKRMSSDYLDAFKKILLRKEQ